MYNFENKIALITGASGDIGAATAKLFNKLGAHVIISGSNKDKLDKLSNELNDNHSIIVQDLSQPNAAETIMNQITRLDYLICNAGVTQDNLMLRMKDEEFDKVINLNLKVNFQLNKLSLKNMMTQRFGRIINISSVVGVTGNAGQANYAAAKAGLIAMSKSLAQEIATRGITVNVVAPGFIETNMTKNLSEDVKNNILNKIPIKCLGLPKDIAHTIAFLASDGANYITGQTLHVNGGMYM